MRAQSFPRPAPMMAEVGVAFVMAAVIVTVVVF